jgi:hypothetical protein
MLARSVLTTATSRRPVRLLAGAVGVAAVVSVLSACDRPLPQISVLSGSTIVRVSPQTYYFDNPQKARVTSGTVSTISASGGRSLLVDVPKEVADQNWSVTAITLDAAGKQTDLDGTGNYFLKVAAAGGSAGGVWLIQVHVTA